MARSIQISIHYAVPLKIFYTRNMKIRSIFFTLKSIHIKCRLFI